MDTITITGIAILLVLALATPWLNGWVRKPKALVSPPPSDSQPARPSVSIVITPHENARELSRYLPLLLQQEYEGDFEVIVVIWKGDSESEDVLKQLAADPHLYWTYIPDSSRYMSRKKLAVTIGIKAAKKDWVLLTDAQCYPTSNKWLATMASNCGEGTNLVYGYTRYDDATADYWRFERLHTDIYLLREAENGTAYRHNSNNLMFRKSEFFEGDGYRGNLKYLRGEYDFIVNKYAKEGCTAVELRPESWLTEQEPTFKEWRNKHLFFMENRQHMERSGRHRFLFNLDQTAMYVNYIAILAAAAFAGLTERWILLAVAAFALLLTIGIRTIIGKKTIAAFQEEIPGWKIVPYEIRLLFHTIQLKYKYRTSDRNDFISHKL